MQFVPAPAAFDHGNTGTQFCAYHIRRETIGHNPTRRVTRILNGPSSHHSATPLQVVEVYASK